ncbi:glycoside hydrolase family 78 protein [Brachybacterium sp. DNPG3]
MIALTPPRFEHLPAAAPATRPGSAPDLDTAPRTLGIGVATPRLSWQIRPSAPSSAAPLDLSHLEQRSYALRIERRLPGAEPVLEEHAADSASSVLVPWPGAPLRSREEARVQVRITTADGTVSSWSPPAIVEAGLLSPLDWQSMGVGPGWDEDASEDLRRSPLLRRALTVRAGVGVRRARLYATAHGVYELELNGVRVGEDVLSPGWTVYPHRLRYRTYDVTALLREGPNMLGAWLGDGWWRGRLGFSGGTLNVYGTGIALLAQLEIEYDDGAVQTVTTDDDWRSRPSPILSSSLLTGETYDARELPDGWSSPADGPSSDTAVSDGPASDTSGTTAASADDGWQGVRLAQFANGTLIAPEGPPVLCTQELSPVSVDRRADGRILLDFGQNHSGRLRVVAGSGVGPELVIRHAEVMQDGELYTRTLRGAVSVDRHLGSTGAIAWEPRFTIHGFRYAEITGYDGPLEGLDVVSRVLHTAMDRTGWLETSDPALDRLHENVVWSLRSNMVDIPTDCPQRDERLGWTGDIQVFAPTASYLYDVSGFLSSWLKDLAVEQRRFGTAPWYVPVIPGGPFWNPARPGAAWGDAAVMVPWALRERFADDGILAEQFASARAWVDQVAELAGPSRLWDTGIQLGDWLDPSAPPEDPAKALTDRHLVATAFFARSSQLLARTAAVLGEEDLAVRYAALAEEVRLAFLDRWQVSPGRLADETQTGYALAIEFELLTDPEALAVAGAALARLVRAGGHRIGAGFAGVNLVSDALSRTGHLEDAFALLLERSTPSWLSMVDKGATTIWERWDSLLDDGTVNPGEMTSFNHYALGSIADWMHRTIGGIAPLEPGYRRILFAPRPGPLTSASARHESPYGMIASRWSVEDGRLRLAVELPVGTRGIVDLPDGTRREVGPGRHELEAAAVGADRPEGAAVGA